MAQLRNMNGVSLAGLFMLVGGIVGVILGGYLFLKADAGLDALDAVYAAQGRTMSYNDEGQFVDRGTVEAGDRILSLIEDDWQFQLNRSNLDPDDPLVNTPDELMVQYAIITYHTLHGTQTVVLDEDVEYNGVLYEAGTYEVEVDGRYFSDLDRRHPLEGPVRDQAWSPLAWGLLASLMNGVNADYMAGMAHFMSWSIFIALGLVFATTGTLVLIGGFQLQRRADATAASRVTVGGTASQGT